MSTPAARARMGEERGRGGRGEERRWALSALLRDLGRRFGEGWRAVPAPARRHWLLWTGAGIALAAVLPLVLVRVMQHLVASGALDWERPFDARAIASSPFSVSTAIWFQTIGTDITLYMLVLLTAGIAVWQRRPFRALSIVLAFVVLDLVVRVGWASWHRQRPDLVLGGAIAPGFASFPSGHTGKTLAVYGMLAFLWARASGSWLERILAFAIVLLLDFLTAYSRLRMGAHWPTDLLGGFTIGLFWLVWSATVLAKSGVEAERKAMAG